MTRIETGPKHEVHAELTPQERWVTCYHEAGHLLAAMLCGLGSPTDYAVVGPEAARVMGRSAPEARGATVIRRACVAQAALPYLGLVTLPDTAALTFRRRVEDAASMLLGGWAAERAYLRRMGEAEIEEFARYGPSTVDYASAARLLGQMSRCCALAFEAVLERLADETRARLDVRLPELDVLAGLLYERGRLTLGHAERVLARQAPEPRSRAEE